MVPDGKQIAFISDHEKDPDQSPNAEIYIIDAQAGATPRKVVTDIPPVASGYRGVRMGSSSRTWWDLK